MKEPKRFSIRTWSISIWILQEIWLGLLRGAGRKRAWIWRDALIAGWRRKSSLWRCSKTWLINKEESSEWVWENNRSQSEWFLQTIPPRTSKNQHGTQTYVVCWCFFFLRGVYNIFRCQPLIFRKGTVDLKNKLKNSGAKAPIGMQHQELHRIPEEFVKVGNPFCDARPQVCLKEKRNTGT